MAVVIVASPRKSAHSSNTLLNVIINEVFCYMEDMNPKNRFASVGGNDRKPTSSIATNATFCRNFILCLLTLDISRGVKTVMRLSSVSKTTV